MFFDNKKQAHSRGDIFCDDVSDQMSAGAGGLKIRADSTAIMILPVTAVPQEWAEVFPMAEAHFPQPVCYILALSLAQRLFVIFFYALFAIYFDFYS